MNKYVKDFMQDNNLQVDEHFYILHRENDNEDAAWVRNGNHLYFFNENGELFEDRGKDYKKRSHILGNLLVGSTKIEKQKYIKKIKDKIVFFDQMVRFKPTERLKSSMMINSHPCNSSANIKTDEEGYARIPLYQFIQLLGDTVVFTDVSGCAQNGFILEEVEYEEEK